MSEKVGRGSEGARKRDPSLILSLGHLFTFMDHENITSGITENLVKCLELKARLLSKMKQMSLCIIISFRRYNTPNAQQNINQSNPRPECNRTVTTTAISSRPAWTAEVVISNKTPWVIRVILTKGSGSWPPTRESCSFMSSIIRETQFPWSHCLMLTEVVSFEIFHIYRLSRRSIYRPLDWCHGAHVSACRLLIYQRH